MKKLLLFLCVLPCFSYFAAGQTCILDASFGSGSPAGTALFGSITGGTFDQAIAVQSSDGKILVSSGDNGGMARLNTNGTIDNTFGSGWVSAGQFSLNDIVVQADGKILCTGRPTAISYQDIYLFRFNTNGTPDNTFGVNGRAGDSSIGGAYARVALQSTNKIVWSGSSGLKRLNLTDGTLDATFGLNGFVRSNALAITPITLAIESSSGNILLGGYTKVGSRLAVMRLLPGGGVDGTFGSNGVDSLSLKSTALGPEMKIALTSTGKIIIVSDYDSATSNRVVCACFNSNGSLDNTFGSGGITALHWNSTGNNQYMGGMAVGAGDMIYVASGFLDDANPGNASDIAVQRLSSGGVYDAGFGIARLNINNANDWSGALALQSDGKVLINGSSASKELVARFTTGTSGVGQVHNDAVQLSLYPNPVHGLATLSIDSKGAASVSAAIYSIDGRCVMNVLDRAKIPAGIFKKEIITNKLAPGIYQLLLTIDGQRQALMLEQW